MIQVTLYSFSKKENSTKVPSGGTNFTCMLLERCSISQPVLKMRLGDSAPSYNYAYIPSFYRYYFIQEWEYVEGLWWAHCIVDVLATYKTEIGASSQYVTRSASTFNGYIPDTLYPCTADWSGSVTQIKAPDSAMTWDTGTYVLTTSGEQCKTYFMTPTQFDVLCNDLFVTILNDNSIWENIADGLKNSVYKPMQYISSLLWMPGTWTVGTPVTIFLGGLPVTAKGAVLNSTFVTMSYQNITVPKHNKAATRGQYMNLEPFMVYSLITPMGTYKLNNLKLIGNSQFNVSIAIDPRTGEGNLVVTAGTQELVNTYGQYATPVPIVQSGTNVLGAVGQTIAAVSSAFAGDWAGAASSAIGSAASAVSPTVANASSIGSSIQHLNGIFLHTMMLQPADDDNTNQGRPLMEVKTINTLSGYLKVENAEIAIADATAGEITQIKTYLEGGLYYE